MASLATPTTTSNDFEPSVVGPEPTVNDVGQVPTPSEDIVKHVKTLSDFGWGPVDKDLPLARLHAEWWGKKSQNKFETATPWKSWTDALNQHGCHIPGLIDNLRALDVLGDDGQLPEFTFANVPLSIDTHSSVLAPSEGRILVRLEYATVLEHIKVARDHFSGIFVGGHVGVGKKYFMIFMLLFFLRRSQPVLIQTRNMTVLFLYHGAYSLDRPAKVLLNVNTVHDLRRAVPPGTTALLQDLGGDVNAMPFLDGTLFYPIVFGLPRRFREFSGSHGLSFVLRILAPFSNQEIIVGALLQGNGVDRGVALLSSLSTAIVRLGTANARNVYEVVFKPTKGFSYQTLENKIGQVTLGDLRSLLLVCSSTEGGPPQDPFFLPPIDDSLLAVSRLEIERPLSGQDISQYFSPSIASPYILHRLRQSLIKKQLSDTRSLMQFLLRHKGLRTAGGVVFEGFMHHILSERLPGWSHRLHLEEIFPLPEEARPTSNWHLRVSHILCKREESLYEGAIPSFDTGSYFVPQASNNATFDAVTYAYVGPKSRKSRKVIGSSTGCNLSKHQQHAIQQPTPQSRPNPSRDPVPLMWRSSPAGFGVVEGTSSSGTRGASDAGLSPDSERTKRRDIAKPGESKVAIALQMTVSDAHSLNYNGLVKLKNGFAKIQDRAFVYVIPQGVQWKEAAMNKKVVDLHAQHSKLGLDQFRWFVMRADVDVDAVEGDDGPGGVEEIMGVTEKSGNVNDST